MKNPAAFILAAVAVGTALAGSPDKFAQTAGPQPSQVQARQAVLSEVRRHVSPNADGGRLRFFSGPQLVTGTNYAKGLEQAWLMCVVEGNARLSRPGSDLEMKPYLLRSRGGSVEVLSAASWSDYDNPC